jgi:hypothetical protein
MALWGASVAAPVAYREGKIEYAPPGSFSSGIAEHVIRAGCGLILGTAGQQVDHPLALAAADPNALVTAAVAISNVAGLTINTIAQFDGAGMGGAMTFISPARQLTITYDADAGWDTPTGQRIDEFEGYDADGNPISDHVIKPNGSGAGTYTTEKFFSFCKQIDMQASNAATGTATIGVGLQVEYGKRDFLGISVYDRMAEPSATLNYDYDANRTVSILSGNGRIGALPEDAVTVGEPVYMRIVAGAGALIRGRFTGQLQADDANFARVLGLMWVTAAAGGNPAVIEVTR